MSSTGADARLVRWSAAVLALAAGALHLGQVRVHFDEDWTFGTFFVAVGILQVAGGLYLVRPSGPARLRRSIAWAGVVGSLATVGIWSVSRTFGLPFGTEPGRPEQVGLADAAADLFEVVTALALVIWLRRAAGRSASRLAVLGAVAAAALIVLWVATRSARLFDPDPRAVAGPELVDASAIAFLVAAGVLFASLRLGWLSDDGLPRPSVYPMLTSLVVTAFALTAFTLPARGGQNRDCAYGPLADDSGLGHIQAPEPIELELGERRSVVILILVACAGRPIELVDVRPLVSLEPSAPIRIDRATLEPSRWARSAWVAARASGPAAAGALLASGTRYPLALEVTAARAGVQALPAVTVEYRDRGERGAMNFAVVVRFAVSGPRE